jgi:prephenate dehydrogenase
MQRLNLGTVGIVGLGIVGCSVGLRLREIGAAKRVIGFDSLAAARKRADRLECVDKTYETLNHLGDADILVLAVPPSAVLPCLVEADVFCKVNCVVTDTSSVKRHVVEWTKNYPLRFGPRFVGGHPMVLRKRQGKRRPEACLFQGRHWILTPNEATDRGALQAVTAMVTALGAKPMVMTPEEHDRHAAILNHLPHALAGILAQLGTNLVYPEMADLNWIELTKGAEDDPDAWVMLLRNNREEVVSALEDLDFTLKQLKKAVEADQHEELLEFFKRAQKARDQWAV